MRLDKKNRLVIPMEARQRLNITNRVLVKLEEGRLVITKANSEQGIIIPKTVKKFTMAGVVSTLALRIVVPRYW